MCITFSDALYQSLRANRQEICRAGQVRSTAETALQHLLNPHDRSGRKTLLS